MYLNSKTPPNVDASHKHVGVFQKTFFFDVFSKAAGDISNRNDAFTLVAGKNVLKPSGRQISQKCTLSLNFLLTKVISGVLFVTNPLGKTVFRKKLFPRKHKKSVFQVKLLRVFWGHEKTHFAKSVWAVSGRHFKKTFFCIFRIFRVFRIF